MLPATRFNTLLLLTVAMALSGCALQRDLKQARELSSQGRFEQALGQLERLAKEHPGNAEVRAARLRSRDEATAALIALAGVERAAGRGAAAELALRRVLVLDPQNVRASGLLLDLEREKRQRIAEEQARQLSEQGQPRAALAAIEGALKDYPRNADLLRLQREIELELRRTEDPTLVRLAETRPVSLEFRDANVRMVFEVLARTTGVNFVIDRDVRTDLRTTIFLRQTRLEDALNRLASVSQLSLRVLDPTTVLVYPNTPEKAKEYQDLLIRGFYLTNADARQTGNLLRSMLKLRDLFVDEKLNLVVVRDTPDAVRLAEKLVAMHDLGDAEVMLEVEVLEVRSSRLLDLGIQFPNSFSLTPLSGGGTGTSAQLTLDDLRGLNSSRIGVSTPSLLLNFKRDVGDVNVLANPRIRARNKEKARILIGDRVPIITTTATGTGFVSESVQYVDVGIKLEVEPSVAFDDDVAIKVALEVSSLAREIRTNTGSLAYQIGTRSANTTLRLRDGETQLLAGLISNEDRKTASRVPGAGDLPILGRLFSSQRDESQKTEIVLSITPRLIRAARMPDAHLSEFWSGTETTLRTRPLTVAAAREGAGGPANLIGSGVPASVVAPGGAGATLTAPSSAPSVDTTRSTDAMGMLPHAAANASSATPARGALAQLDGPQSVRAGQEFEVSVRLRTTVALRALPMQLAYDPGRLQVLEVRDGGFFKEEGAESPISHQIVGNEGRVQITAQHRAKDGVQGEGVVVKLRIRAKGAGQATLALRSAVALATQGTDPQTSLGPPLDIAIQ